MVLEMLSKEIFFGGNNMDRIIDVSLRCIRRKNTQLRVQLLSISFEKESE